MKVIKFLILCVVFYFIAYLFYSSAINSPVGRIGEDVDFAISQGETVKDISDNLSDAGLIKSRFFFELYVMFAGKEAEFKAGEYVLNPIMSAVDVVDQLTQGKVVDQERMIRVIEGWSIKDINSYLLKEDVIADSDAQILSKRSAEEWSRSFKSYDILKDIPVGKNLEGFLFPDTYRIFVDASLDDIVGKMLGNMNAKIDRQMRAEIKKQGKTVYEVVIMASLIEKEVKTEDDMKLVSDVFWDRIEYGQPLQSCASLAYILGENKPQYSIEDTKIDSPYNLYQNKGLTPTPICNPSLKAIRAAIYPTENDYNFFLSRPDTGETVFSKSYEEHLINKAKYGL